MQSSILKELQWRGLINQCTDEAGLDALCGQKSISLYCGFDPTAASLHVGNLIPLLTLARFQHEGHRVLALIGGATGLIGDPSGKSEERTLQDPKNVRFRSERISAQIQDFLEEEKSEIVNNLHWTQGVSVLDFLRDVGKHFSVNAMLNRDSVKTRLAREGEGLSYTEFSYMLLQSMDFLHLSEQEDCVLQVGGSDQWGNMCSGADLVRRKTCKEAFALTVPLLITSNGQKFGKTAKGAIWLDPTMTAPWDFHQFWLNTSDSDVGTLLRLYTFLSQKEIEALELSTKERPQLREAQRQLAAELTTMVHGEEVSAAMESAASVLFGGAPVSELSKDALDQLTQALPYFKLAPGEDMTISFALKELGVEDSFTKANTSIKEGAVHLNGERVMCQHDTITGKEPLRGNFWLIRKGKKTFAIVEGPGG